MVVAFFFLHGLFVYPFPHLFFILFCYLVLIMHVVSTDRYLNPSGQVSLILQSKIH